jgi:hypothetical protein
MPASTTLTIRLTLEVKVRCEQTPLRDPSNLSRVR